MIKKIMYGLGLLAYSSGLMAAAAPLQQPLTVNQFVDKMVQVDHYNRGRLVRLFQQTEYVPEVVDRINKPFEEKPWDFYKSFFITADRIEGGVVYWRQHAAALDKVARQYGVSPAVIIAIIGIETRYGKEPSKYPELGALATLSFHYPKRGVFFQNELENYLLLTQEHNLPPLQLKGSYAGALGIPQFMPSNYRKYAVSYAGKDSVNLLENHEDAIVSIAHYLQKSGWRAHQPVAMPARLVGEPRPWLFSKDAKPVFRLKTLEKFGVQGSIAESPQRKSALVVMHNTHNDEYWLTFQNFYAIMAYNPRTTYAMAIFQLSQAIQTQYEKQSVQASATAPTRR